MLLSTSISAVFTSAEGEDRPIVMHLSFGSACICEFFVVVKCYMSSFYWSEQEYAKSWHASHLIPRCPILLCHCMWSKASCIQSEACSIHTFVWVKHNLHVESNKSHGSDPYLSIHISRFLCVHVIGITSIAVCKSLAQSLEPCKCSLVPSLWLVQKYSCMRTRPLDLNMTHSY